MTEVEVTCRLDERSCVESQSHVESRYDVVTAMTPYKSLRDSLTQTTLSQVGS